MMKSVSSGKTTPQPLIQPVSERFPALESREITLALDAPGASDVRVAGDFNDWQPDRTPLVKNRDGEWVARVGMRSGRYEYRFVVDGRWMEDPCAGERAPNGRGGFNSILVVPLAVRTSIL